MLPIGSVIKSKQCQLSAHVNFTASLSLSLSLSLFHFYSYLYVCTFDSVFVSVTHIRVRKLQLQAPHSRQLPDMAILKASNFNKPRSSPVIGYETRQKKNKLQHQLEDPK